MSKDVEEHIQKRTLQEFLHYPHHGERTETKEFRNSKNELESVEHLGCYKCGSMKKRESHHIFERAWANGLDFKKVAFFLYEHFDFHGHCHRDFKSHEELLQYFIGNFKGRVVKGSYQAVDEHGEPSFDEDTGKPRMVHYEYVYCDDEALDTIYNQWILCEDEHIGKYQGIHEIDGAAFMSSLALHPNFHNVMTKVEKEAWEKQHQEA